MIEKSDSYTQKIEKAVEKIKALGGERIRFIILYGSGCKNCQREGSDIDICVYYDDESKASNFRLKVLSDLFEDIYDIKIFQQLPVYVRMEVLKGEILYCNDRRFLYDKAHETIKEFDAFKHRYYDYIGAEAIR